MPEKSIYTVVVCGHCRSPFQTQISRLHAGRGKYCSRNCQTAARRSDPKARFLRFIAISGDCWIWTGGYDHKRGYGIFWLHGTTINAHRASWILHRGDIPDMRAKGREVRTRHCERMVRGESNHNHKLTAERVKMLRDAHGQGVSIRQLARQYAVSPATISRAIMSETWKHVAS